MTEAARLEKMYREYTEKLKQIIANPVEDVKAQEDRIEELIQQYEEALQDHFRRNQAKAGRRCAENEPDTLQAIFPKKVVIPNSYIANHITTSEPGKTVEYQPLKNNADIVSRFLLNYDSADISLEGGKLTEYDRCIADSVTSLHIAGNKYITPFMVYKALTGNAETHTISEAITNKISASLEKMRRIDVVIDCTDEVKISRRKGSARLKGYLLPLSQAEVMIQGERRTVFEIIDTPILYKHAAQRKQVISVPTKLLQIDEASTTESRTVIVNYLLRRIAEMRGNKMKSNKILFSTVFEVLSVTDRAEKKRIRDYITQVLESWKKADFISEFSYEKDSRNSFRAISITV